VPKGPAIILIGRQDGKRFLFADYFSGLLSDASGRPVPGGGRGPSAPPRVLRILLENVLPQLGLAEEAASILSWLRTGHSAPTTSFNPGSVMIHNTICGPALVDIAEIRSELAESGCCAVAISETTV